MATEIRIEVASVRDRVLARAIDLFVVLQFLTVAFIFLAITGGDTELALFQTVLLGVLGFPAMDVMCTSITGATPGKRARGLGVSYGPELHRPPPYIHSLIRTLFLIYGAPLLLLFLWRRDSWGRLLHDVVTATWVHKVVETPATDIHPTVGLGVTASRS